MDEHQAQDSFYIASAGSPVEQRPRVLKAEETFGIFDRHGDILSDDPAPKGLFRDDTRHLSHYALLLDGVRPLFLSSSDRETASTLWIDLANADRFEDGRLTLGRVIHLARVKLLRPDGCGERILVENFDEQPQTVRITLRYAADFRDMFELRGLQRARRGDVTTKAGADRVVLRYRAVDGVESVTTLRFEPEPVRLDGRGADFEILLAPRGQAVLFVDVTLDAEAPAEQPSQRFVAAVEASRVRREERQSARAGLHTPDRLLFAVLERASADLDMLTTRTRDGPYPYAGIPWFTTVFGRDGILSALLAGWLDPALSLGVLKYLAANQATAVDEPSAAEPGKILHEVRGGEMARVGEVPFAHYYGSVDSTPLFLILLGSYVRQTGDLSTARDLWPNVEAALEWLERWGDLDGDGYIEYRSHERGLHNQGWKDSKDSVMHADGRLAEGPIALVEVQAYQHAALLEVGRLGKALGHDAMAERLVAKASRLGERFEADFWDNALGTYGLALDGHKRLCRVRSSNAGHALWAGIAGHYHAERAAQALQAPESFTGWGVRTLAKGERRYNPMSYHDGSIWPHDNAMLALGLSRYGLRHEAARIATALFDVSLVVDQHRLPELFCGFARDERPEPVRYPVACSPQAWAAASVPGLLMACLGLRFDSAARSLRLEQPTLPDGWQELHMTNLCVGDDCADLVIRRRADEIVGVGVLRRTGRLRVSVIH
jgi:glycogen debranching enzyme